MTIEEPLTTRHLRRRRLVLPAVTVVASLMAGWAGGTLTRDPDAADVPTSTTATASPASVVLD